MLAVRDTSVGMDDETRGRIFEPFFTTKDVGEGTGLGLATVYGIVAKSGGTIDVECEPGRGATFTVRLPRGARTPSAREAATTDVGEAGGSERILLVEDEAHVRALVADMLREQGYHVVAAASPREALRVDDPWDLLVADIVMPEMNGIELARRLRAASSSRPATTGRRSSAGTRRSSRSRSRRATWRARCASCSTISSLGS